MFDPSTYHFAPSPEIPMKINMGNKKGKKKNRGEDDEGFTPPVVEEIRHSVLFRPSKAPEWYLKTLEAEKAEEKEALRRQQIPKIVLLSIPLRRFLSLFQIFFSSVFFLLSTSLTVTLLPIFTLRGNNAKCDLLRVNETVNLHHRIM